MHKRVIIKLSGEALRGHNGNTYNRDLILEIAQEIKLLLQNDVQIVIVVGGGNFWRGARSDNRVNRVNSDNIGMLATAMNAIYLSDSLEAENIKNKVLSPISIGNVFTLFNRTTAIDCLESGQVVIIACGTGHPYFSTDTSTALYALEVDSDLILMLKFGVDGAYTKDPNKYPDAKLIEQTTYNNIVANQDLNIVDKAAAALLSDKDIPAVILGFGKGNILKAVKSEKIGTLVTH